MSDAAILAKRIDDPTIHRNTLRLPKPYKLSDAKKWINKNIRESRKKYPDFVAFVIEIDGQLGGSIGVHNIQSEHKAEIGYWLAKRFWGHGYMTEALKRVVKFSFSSLKLRRLYSYTFVFNKESQRVLTKSGFKKEGLLIKQAKKGSKLIDEIIFAKLKK